jgi:hypothetical protein
MSEMFDIQIVDCPRCNYHIPIPPDPLVCFRLTNRIDTLEAQLRDIGKESLYRLMLQLSEDVFLAGWYIDLLTVCKDAVEGKRKLPADYTEKLTEYHKLAGGWWDWNDTTQSVMFIPDKMRLPNPPEEKA